MGRPLGSPDLDWFAAERAVYASLVAAGTIASSSNAPQNIRRVIGRWMQGGTETQSSDPCAKSGIHTQSTNIASGVG